MRLIDADKLMRELEINKSNANPLDYNTKATYAECITMVSAMETIDAEHVRHGRWEYNSGDNIPYCNQCAMPQDVPTNYCHECGAKMDGGADDAKDT